MLLGAWGCFHKRAAMVEPQHPGQRHDSGDEAPVTGGAEVNLDELASKNIEAQNDEFVLPLKRANPHYFKPFYYGDVYVNQKIIAPKRYESWDEVSQAVYESSEHAQLLARINEKLPVKGGWVYAPDFSSGPDSCESTCVFASSPTGESMCCAYQVKYADSLSRIAIRAYGNYRRWKHVYHKNRAVVGSDPNLIFPGQVLRL